MCKSIPNRNNLSPYLKNHRDYSFSHPLLNPCPAETYIMVVLSKLVVMYICSNWWVMAGGFPHPLLNQSAVKTINGCVFKVGRGTYMF